MTEGQAKAAQHPYFYPGQTWRPPLLFTHIFDNPSSTVTLGYLVFIMAVAGMFLKERNGLVVTRLVGGEDLMMYIFISSALVGGKLVASTILEGIIARRGGVLPSAAPEPKKEVKSDAPNQPA